MGNSDDDRSLDEIITDNAHFLIKRRIVARRVERKPYFLNTLAAEMIPYMIPDEVRGSPEFVMNMAIDRISQSMKRYLGLGDKIAWRMDYLEGFIHAMGVPITEILDGQSAPTDMERELLEQMMGDAEWRIRPPKRAERKLLPPKG